MNGYRLDPSNGRTSRGYVPNSISARRWVGLQAGAGTIAPTINGASSHPRRRPPRHRSAFEVSGMGPRSSREHMFAWGNSTALQRYPRNMTVTLHTAHRIAVSRKRGRNRLHLHMAGQHVLSIRSRT